MLLSCNKRNIYWLRSKIILPKVAVWSQILMLLKVRIKNTSNELSDITCKIFLFRVNYILTVLAFGIKILSLKVKTWGKLLNLYFYETVPYNDLMLLSCNKRNIYWLRSKIILPKVAVWSQILMLLKVRIKNTSNELSDITCKIFLFRVNYVLTVLPFGIKIFSLKVKT